MITKTEKWVLNPKRNNDKETKNQKLNEIKSYKKFESYDDILYSFDFSAPESLKYIESYISSLDIEGNNIDLNKLKREILVRNMYLLKKEFTETPQLMFSRYKITIEDYINVLLKYSILTDNNNDEFLIKAVLNFFKKYISMNRCKIEFCKLYNLDETIFDELFQLLKNIDREFYISIQNIEEERLALFNENNNLLDAIENYIKETMNTQNGTISSEFKELDYYSMTTQNIDLLEMIRKREIKDKYVRTYLTKKILGKRFEIKSDLKITPENISRRLGTIIVDNNKITEEEIINAYYILEENQIIINKNTIIECVKRIRNKVELFPYRERYKKESKNIQKSLN